MKIAVDAMGGDFAPLVVIEGVADALEMDELKNVELVLVGDTGKLGMYLEKFSLAKHPRISLVHADTVVEMGDPSTAALRTKKNSSITVAAGLLAAGTADALVSAGHTGAAVAATTVKVRTLPGIDRPAIATVMPATEGRFIIVDAGANTDCRPIHLAQFALMGEAYSRFEFGIEAPKVGLLSVGGEDLKGNELTKEAFKILSGMPINFVGNIEGHDMFQRVADVVVCDGFVGNVLIKSAESLAAATMHWLKDAFKKNAFRMTGALLARNAFHDLKAVADFEEFGGAPLLGLRSPCFIGHGKSTGKAVKNAIRVAAEFVEANINEEITKSVAACGVAATKVEK